MSRILIALGLTAVALSQPTAAALAQQADKAAPAGETAFDRRAGQLVDLFAGHLVYADYFAPTFEQAVPEAQFKTLAANLIAQYGQPVAVESTNPLGDRRGTVKLRFEKAVGTVAFSVESGPRERVDGLRIQNFEMANDSFDAAAAELAALLATGAAA